MHPANKLKNLKRRVNRARRFPENTCAASRHVYLMAESLASGDESGALDEEDRHCAESMFAVLESLWKLRTELAKLKS